MDLGAVLAPGGRFHQRQRRNNLKWFVRRRNGSPREIDWLNHTEWRLDVRNTATVLIATASFSQGAAIIDLSRNETRQNAECYQRNSCNATRQDMKNCTICLMDDAKIDAVRRALEYDVPIRTLAALLDISKDIVARHKAHMHNPPPLRFRQSRSRPDLYRQIAREIEQVDNSTAA